MLKKIKPKVKVKVNLKNKLIRLNIRQWRVIGLSLFLLSLTFLPLIGYKRQLVDEVRWQRTTINGINKLHLLPSSDGSIANVITGGLDDIYCLDIYTGAVRWSLTHLPPPYSHMGAGAYNFHDTALADVDNDGRLDFLVGYELVFNGTIEGLDVHGGLYIFDAYTGALTNSYSYANGTWLLGVGTFKPCEGKGIILDCEYYPPGLTFIVDVYESFLILDGSTLQPVYNLTLNPSDSTIMWFSTYDLTFDGYDEIIISLYNSTVIALDGQDFDILWNSTVFPTSGFYARDCDFYDLTSDGIPDLVLNSASGICALDGSNGTVLWRHSFGHGDRGTAIADVDNDGKVEVITTDLEDLYIVDGLSGDVEVQKRTPFPFDGGEINVVDIYGNGTLYIFATSFYGGAYLFSSGFDYIRSLHVPHGWIYHCLFIDLNHDGIIELLGGCFDGSNAAFLYYFSGTFTYPFFLYLFFILFAFAFLLSLFLCYRTFFSPSSS